MNENTNPAKRREWVKNAAIIFLSIMLVLTFFSNTIMNYSLPEVATEYVQSGTITEKVRGTGTITASDPYNVSISESRVISSVAVKAGDEVKKGDPLFYLEDMESTELMDAEKELNSLILAYQLAVITESMEVGTVSNIEGDRTLSLTQKQQRLQNAISTVDAAQAEYDAATLQVASVNKELGYIGNQVVDTTSEKNAVSNAQREANAAGQSVANAQVEIDRASTDLDAAKGNLENVTAAAENIEKAKQELETATINYNQQKESLSVNQENANQEVERTTAEYNEVNSECEKVEGAYNSWYENNKDTASAEDIAREWQAVETIRASRDNAKAAKENAEAAKKKVDEDLLNAQQQYENAAKMYNDLGGDNAYNNAAMNIENAQKAVNNAEGNLYDKTQEKANRESEKNAKDAAVSNAQQALTDKENNNDNSINKANVSNQLLDAQDRQAKAEINLNKAKEDLAEVQKELLAEINLESQNDAIELQQEKVEKLREKSVGATIDAPVDGIVMNVNKAAGEKTEPEEALAVMQVAGKGFTLVFSATTEQARKLSVGDIAELQNAWYYDNVKATLTSIKPDPDDPAQKKQLTFQIEGDVQSGQSLSLSVGQRSADYELVVPNSAIREDNNGKFILIVESKSSPLGNRYIATRVDVEVVASDDTHTAISAGLYGYEYVITTATKPVEAGKQVRLTD
ncbi:MAG: HlyD family efflux transporter periplasmic adaptor subunit [Kineothrix sp.]|nr:HlyD family efflux transporter periplasmic adaptor subunit [Kineothrix sp.]